MIYFIIILIAAVLVLLLLLFYLWSKMNIYRYKAKGLEELVNNKDKLIKEQFDNMVKQFAITRQLREQLKSKDCYGK